MIAVLTGKGGAGTTTVAVATALAAAATGLRTLVAGLGEPGSLARVLGWDGREPLRLRRLEGVGPGEVRAWDVGRGPFAARAQPTPVGAPGDGAGAGRADGGATGGEAGASAAGGETAAGAGTAGAVDRLDGLGRRVLRSMGLGRLEPEEVRALPGLGDLDRLAELAQVVADGGFDLVVLDAGPMAEGLRLLGWLDLVAAAAGEHPARASLESLAEALADPGQALAWIVMTGEPTAVEAAREAAARLSLLRLHLAAVVVNRLFVPSVTSGYLSAWAGTQSRVLAEARGVFRDLPITPCWLQPEEVVGVPALLRLAEDLYGGRDLRTLFRGGEARGEAAAADEPGAADGRGAERRAPAEDAANARAPEWPARFLDPRELVALRRGDSVALVTPRYRGLVSLPPGSFGRPRWHEDRLAIE